jgi:glucosamine--fructose-6-phosphate aminotransferase (isomerizing)
MCGIIAGISPHIATLLLDGLKQLQNRGYDSAGISLYNNDSDSYFDSESDNSFFTIKKASTSDTSALTYLERKITESESESESVIINENTIGIGHTRWATHGAKNDINSHPHTSYNGSFVLVHNGIIENYQNIKEILKKNGIINVSETDTECIVNLLAFHYEKEKEKDNKKRVEDAIRKTVDMLEGTWGLAIMCRYTPNTLYCTRQGSPILVGHSDSCAVITSEQSGFSGHIQNYFILKNKDICTIEQDGDKSIHIHTCEEKYTKKQVNQSANELTPTPYSHWMLKEINEQVESIKRVIKQGSRLLENDKVHLGGLNDNCDILKTIDHIVLLGCGTSLNAAKFAIHYFKSLCFFNSISWCDGADFSIEDVSPIGTTALILLSQSGETKDLHRCIEIANHHNLFTIGIVNVVDSLIAREVECGCYLHAGREVAVGSTKSFTSQALLLVMVAMWFSQIQEPRVRKNIQRKHIIHDIRNLSNDIKKTLECHQQIKDIAKYMVNYNSCFVLGKGKSEAIAHEGSLKIKEISYIHAEGYSTSSLKHGPFALLHEGYPVVLISPEDDHFAKSQNAYEEIKSRGAKIFTITDNISDDSDSIILPKNTTFASLLAIIPLQLLSYEIALLKNINPDQPRNLAKVVTVE